MFNYQTFSTALAIEMAVPNNNPTDPQFVAVLPTLIDQAEQRCYRELDLLTATITRLFPSSMINRTVDFTASNAVIHAPGDPQILIPEDVYALTPNLSTTSPPGVANPLVPVSREWLMAVYGDPSAIGVPRFFAPLTDTQIIVGPLPDLPYNISITGKFRPAPIYTIFPADGTQTSFLTTVLPDLFLAAAMVVRAGSAYQHTIGARSPTIRATGDVLGDELPDLARPLGEGRRRCARNTTAG